MEIFKVVLITKDEMIDTKQYKKYYFINYENFYNYLSTLIFQFFGLFR